MKSRVPTYRVERYSAMGHDPTTLVQVEGLSLKQARAFVRMQLHVTRLMKARLWSPPDDMGGGEAYHDCRPSHPNAEGCGGFHIIPEANEPC